MARNEDLFNAILNGKRKDAKSIVEELVAQGVDVIEMMNDSMIPAMREMGAKFSRNEVYVPEMLISARAMQAGLNIIEPIMAANNTDVRSKVIIGTVKGDLHDIGKNLVAMMLKGSGYEVIDLGVDCDCEKFHEAAVSNNVKIVLLSALLTTTMQYMKEVVDRFKGDTDVKVLIGGAPVTSEYAEEIGAHGYSKDANEAVKLVDSFLVG
jgi:methylmalonyl-CoA mutase cobalamin-binding domain/chain